MVKKVKRFLRREWNKYSKLGRRRNKKQKWKRPTGRHNKMREKKKGYPAVVEIGYGTPRNERGKINGKSPIVVNNIQQLEKISRDEIAIIGNVGRMKKIELAKKAQEKGIEVYNLNPKIYLKQIEKEKTKGAEK